MVEMSVKVTLNIDNDLYRRAEKLARLRRRDVADLLAEQQLLFENIRKCDRMYVLYT
jgi:hypothetical protein